MVRRSIGLLAATGALVVSLVVPARGAFVVTASGFAFTPKRAEVADGTRVVWRAVGGTHTVTAYGGGWSKDVRIRAGEKTGFTFGEPGIYRYRCKIHGTVADGRCTGMCGRVRVD